MRRGIAHEGSYIRRDIHMDEHTYGGEWHMKGHTHGGTYAWRGIYMDQHRYGGECTRKDIHAEEYTHRGDIYSIQTVDILHHLLEGLSTRWNARPTRIRAVASLADRDRALY